jgi:hypothetical protein
MSTYRQRIGPDLIEIWEEDDDWPEGWWDEREPGIETACMNCGELGSGDACQCCGGPLCFVCGECWAGFCEECLKDPDFSAKTEERMRSI